MGKMKKPYEKPELKGKITFEAAGTGTCCKLSAAAGCTAGVKGVLKNAAANTSS